MTTSKLIRSHLERGAVMQMATVAGDQPWICTVYYVVDDELNLYWLSYPTRRHSQELINNSSVAITIAVKHDQPVIGIQAEGSAHVVEDSSVVEAMTARYIQKYDTGHDFLANFKAEKNRHEMYCFKPSSYVLFDEVNFPKDSQQKIFV